MVSNLNATSGQCRCNARASDVTCILDWTPSVLNQLQASKSTVCSPYPLFVSFFDTIWYNCFINLASRKPARIFFWWMVTSGPAERRRRSSINEEASTRVSQMLKGMENSTTSDAMQRRGWTKIVIRRNIIISTY